MGPQDPVKFATPRQLRGWVIAVALLAALCWVLKSILVPFLIAFLLAYALYPAVARISRYIPRPLAILLFFLAIILVLAAILLLVIPAVESEIALELERLPHYWDLFQKNVLPRIERTLRVRIPRTLDETTRTMFPKIKDESPGLVRSISEAVFHIFSNTVGLILVLINLLLIPFATYYFLADFEQIGRGAASLVPPRYRPAYHRIIGEIDTALSGFIRGQLLIVLILIMLYSVSLWIVGLDLAVVLGVLVGTMELVPFAGFMVGLTSAVLITLLQFQDLLHPLSLFALFSVVQIVNTFALTPKIIGHQAGLHPLWVMGALYIGADFFGIAGLLLAVPAATVIQVLLKALVRAYQSSPIFSSPAD